MSDDVFFINDKKGVFNSKKLLYKQIFGNCVMFWRKIVIPYLLIS